MSIKESLQPMNQTSSFIGTTRPVSIKASYDHSGFSGGLAWMINRHRLGDYYTVLERYNETKATEPFDHDLGHTVGLSLFLQLCMNNWTIDLGWNWSAGQASARFISAANQELHKLVRYDHYTIGPTIGYKFDLLSWIQLNPGLSVLFGSADYNIMHRSAAALEEHPWINASAWHESRLKYTLFGAQTRLEIGSFEHFFMKPFVDLYYYTSTRKENFNLLDSELNGLSAIGDPSLKADFGYSGFRIGVLLGPSNY